MAQINKPNQHFNVKTYTGNGTDNNATQSINMGLQPDLCWIKARTDTAQENHLFDSVRGGALRLVTNSGAGENNANDRFDGITSTGFDLIQDDAGTNLNGKKFVAWGWKANGSTTVSNTDGDITSNVSVNSTAGFSIVSFVGNGGTNQTIGHGLSQKPDLIIAKNRDRTINWRVWHNSYNATNDIFYLNTDNTKQSNSDGINSVQDTTFTASANTGFIANNEDIIAYCWHEVKGYSKFGSYTGNGSADGTFVYCGFKPAFIIVKNATDTNGRNWFISDNKRNTDNPHDKELYADVNVVEGTSSRFDFLSSGFKNISASSGNNRANDTFIYMAFAEQPLVGTNNIPSTAR